jgi:hypothetical protein
LAARFVRDEEAAGSNPATPTKVRALIQLSERELCRHGGPRLHVDCTVTPP